MPRRRRQGVLAAELRAHDPHAVARPATHGGQVIQLIQHGTFDRFPELQLFFAETQIGWIPEFKEDADENWRAAPFWSGADQWAHEPSWYVDHHFHWGFQIDRFGVKVRHDIGVDRIQWSTDFPHVQCDWPNSRKIIDEQFADVPDDERRRIVRDNAVRVLPPRPRPAAADAGAPTGRRAMTGLLEGVTVVETGVLMTVDYLGRLLGDEGADVVKVETPQLGDYLRNIMTRFAPDWSAFHLTLNRNKRSLTCDARTRRGPRGPGAAARRRRHLHHRQRGRHQPQARPRLRDRPGDPARHRVLPGHRLRRVGALRRRADARPDDGRARRRRAADGARRRRLRGRDR